MAKVIVICGEEGTNVGKLVAELSKQLADEGHKVAEFDATAFAERDPIYLYASETKMAGILQSRLYQNNNNVKDMWVAADGIHIRTKEDFDISIRAAYEYERYSVLLAFFLLEHYKNAGATIIVQDFAKNASDLKVLDFLDTLRELVIHNDINLILTTHIDKKAALAKQKYAFLDEEFVWRQV